MARTGKTILVKFKEKKWQQLLVVQALFILGFQLFGIQSVYLLIALALGFILFVKEYRSLTTTQRMDVGLMVTSITIFTLFLSISPLYLESGSWLRNGLLALGFPATYVLGFLLVKRFHITYELIIKTLLIGLSCFVLVNLIYTVYRYLPFYRFHLAGQVIYVNGEVYTVSEEVKWLIGLAFKEVNVRYMAFYLTLLLTPWLSQIHNLKAFKLSDWRIHGWWLLPTIVGLLGVVLLPVYTPVIINVILATLIWVYPYVRRVYQTHSKYIKPVIFFGLALIAALAVLFFVEAYDVFGLGTLVKQLSPLRTLLDFPLIEGYQEVLRSFLTYPFGGFAPILVSGRYLTSTQSFVFDTLHQAGIFATFGLVMVGIYFMNQLLEFSKNNTVSVSMRMTLVWLVATFMLYQTFQTQLYPFVREDMRLFPRLMLDEPLWMVMMLLLGTIMIDPFVGLLKLEKNPSKKKSSSAKVTPVAGIKKPRKATTLRKEKSQSKFLDRWQELD